MTVSSQTSTATFVGNGVATAFPLPFRFFDNGDIRAYFIDSVTGAATQMVLGTDYTLIGAGEPEVDGNALSLLTTTAPLASMRGLYVERVMPQVQETDIVNQGQFFASTHEDVFDRLTMLIQQANANSAGAIRVAIGDPEPQRLPPSIQRANLLLGFDSQGQPRVVAPVSGNAADLAIDLANYSDPSKGAGIVGWKRSALSSAITTVSQMLSAQAVNIWEFADAVVSKPIPGDPNSWDWTPALQAAADSLPSFELPTNGDIYISIPKGRYKIGSVDLGYRRNLVFEGGVLAPLDTVTARSHMLKLGGRNRIVNLTVDADYATNYDTIVWFRGRYIDMISPEIWKAKCAFVFGDPAWEGVPAAGALGDSEINILGGSTNWCITNARAYGQNTIVQYGAGHQAYSYKWTLPDGDPRKAAWEALPEYTFINVGAVIYLTGCFTGNFSGQAANFLSKIQPADGADYFNVYGRFHINGTHLETGKILTCAPNGAVPIQDSKTQLLQMAGCSGYLSLGPGYIIDAQNAQQAIHINACSFYGQPNDNICYAAAADVYISQDSFTVNNADFFQCLAVRYPSGFGGFTALDASGTVQAFTPTAQTLKMPTVVPSDVHHNFSSIWYNSATGIFTAQTTMRDVDIAVGLVYNAGLASDTTEFSLYVGGALAAIASVNGAAPSTVFKIPKLLRSATLEVRVASANSRTPFGGLANYMRVSCSKTSGVK